MKIKDALAAGTQLTFTPDLLQEAKLRDWARTAYEALKDADDALTRIEAHDEKLHEAEQAPRYDDYDRVWCIALDARDALNDVLRTAEEEL